MEDPSLVLVDLIVKCTLNLLTRRGRQGVSTVDSLVEAVFNGTGIEGNGKRTLDGWRKGAPGKDYPIGVVADMPKNIFFSKFFPDTCISLYF